jgi:hypothetical protein
MAWHIYGVWEMSDLRHHFWVLYEYVLGISAIQGNCKSILLIQSGGAYSIRAFISTRCRYLLRLMVNKEIIVT